MKRYMPLALAALIVVGCLAGCGASTTPASQSSSVSSQNSAAAPSGSSANAAPTAPGGIDVSQVVAMTAVATVGSTSVFPYPIVDQLFEQAGIDVTWQLEPSGDWNTKKGVLLASGNLPDIFFGTALLDTEVNGGAFLDWAPYLNIAPNISRFLEEVPTAKSMCTTADGQIWGIPNKIAMRPESGDTLYINQVWLDKFNLPMPKTTDEYYETLKHFVENDANGNGAKDELGFSGNGQGTTNAVLWDAGKVSWVFPAFGVMMNQSDTLCMVKDGEPVFGPTMDGYKEAMKYINNMYSEGLLDQEYFNLDFATMAAKFRGEEMYIASGSGWTMSNTLGPNTGNYTLMEPLIGPNGDQGWNSSTYNYRLYANRAAISASCKYPERAVYLFDLCYDEYNNFQLTYGSEGIGVERDSSGNPAFLPVPEGYTDPEWKMQNGMDTRAPGWTGDAFVASITGKNDMFEKYNFDIFYSKWFKPETRYPYIYWDKATQDELAILKTDIDSGVIQGMVDFVMNGDIDAKWDNYVQGLNRMGLDRLMEIYKKGYQENK